MAYRSARIAYYKWINISFKTKSFETVCDKFLKIGNLAIYSRKYADRKYEFSTSWLLLGLLVFCHMEKYPDFRVPLLRNTRISGLDPEKYVIFSPTFLFFKFERIKKKWKVDFDIGEMSVRLSVVGKVWHQLPIFCTICLSVRPCGWMDCLSLGGLFQLLTVLTVRF